MGQYTLRVPPDLLERADKLTTWLSSQADYAAIHGGSGLSRSAVLRLALLQGLRALEHDFFVELGDGSVGSYERELMRERIHDDKAH